jgi:hypothetical protein
MVGMLACRHVPHDASPRVATNAAAISVPEAGIRDDVRALTDAAPSGWQTEVRDTADVGIGPMIVVEFTDRDRSCEIHYGAGGANVRTERSVVRLLFYRRADEASLHAAEAPLRSLSSHCPRDIELGRTASHFIALDVCGRAYMTDPGCAARSNELEASLRRTLGERNDDRTR